MAKKTELEAELVNVRERLKKPEYFTFAKPEDVPADLKWEDGMNEPEIGDPNAKKGGTMRHYILSFPADAACARREQQQLLPRLSIRRRGDVADQSAP
jgi:hypothetical protein